MGDSRPRTPPRVMALAMGLKFVVLGFLLTTHAKTNAKQMCPRSLHAVRHFKRVYLHAHTAVVLVYSIFILEKLFQYNSTGLPKGPDFKMYIQYIYREHYTTYINNILRN